MRRSGGLVEKGVDVRLATDMVTNGFKNLYDVAILISGDADFSHAIQAVKDVGKHVEVAYPLKAKPAPDLLRVADVYTDLVQPTYIKIIGATATVPRTPPTSPPPPSGASAVPRP